MKFKRVKKVKISNGNEAKEVPGYTTEVPGIFIARFDREIEKGLLKGVICKEYSVTQQEGFRITNVPFKRLQDAKVLVQYIAKLDVDWTDLEAIKNFFEQNEQLRRYILHYADMKTGNAIYPGLYKDYQVY